MKFYKIDPSFGGDEVYIIVSRYVHDPHVLAVNLVSRYEGPYARLTTNLDYDFERSEKSFCCSFLNVNTSFNIEDFVKSNKIAEPVLDDNRNVITYQSGYVSYPLYRFNQDILKESDEKEFEEYKKSFNEFLNSK